MKCSSVLFGGLVALCAVSGAQEAQQDVGLAVQVRIGDAGLVVPSFGSETSDTPGARWLEDETTLGGWPHYSTGGVLQWRTSEHGGVLKTVPLQSWPAVQSLSISSVEMALGGQGTILATRGDDSTVRWQNTWTGQLLQEWKNETSPMDFSSRGELFLAHVKRTAELPENRSEVVIHEVPSGREVARWRATAVSQVEFSPDGAQVLRWKSGWLGEQKVGELSYVALHDTRSGRELWQWGNGERLLQVKFTAAGIVAVSSEKIDEREEKSVAHVRRWEVVGENVSLSDDNSVLYPGRSWDQKWRIQDDGEVFTANVREVAANRSWLYHRWPLTGTPQNITAAQWQAATGVVLQIFGANVPAKAPASKPPLARTSPLKMVRVRNGRTVVADAGRLWELVDGRLMRSFAPLAPLASQVELSPDGALFSAAGGGGFGSSGGAFHGVWSVSSGKLLWHREVSLNRSNGSSFAETGTQWATALRFSPDSHRLLMTSALGYEASPIEVRDARSGKVLWSVRPEYYRDPIADAAWLPDAREIVVSTYRWSEDLTSVSGAVQFFDAKTGKAGRRWTTAFAGALAPSPDGKMLAVNTRKGEVQRFDNYSHYLVSEQLIELRDVSSGEIVRVLRGLQDSAYKIVWSRDGTRIAAAGISGAVNVWDAKTGALLHRFEGHAGAVRDLAWSDDNLLCSVGDDGSARFHRVDSGRTVATAQLLFAPPEKKQFAPDKNQRRPLGGGVWVEAPPTEWVLYTPKNFYRATPGAKTYLRWRINTQLFPLSDFAVRYEKPTVVRNLIAGQMLPALPAN